MAESKTLGFDLPSESPSGEAIFSWTWFNHFGKREMYQVSCLILEVMFNIADIKELRGDYSDKRWIRTE